MKTHVIVVNADKIKLTGDKWVAKKLYQWHVPNQPGGIPGVQRPKSDERSASRGIWFAAPSRGMLPKNRLGHATMKRLRLFTTSDHPHQAQRPTALPVRTPAEV